MNPSISTKHVYSTLDLYQSLLYFSIFSCLPTVSFASISFLFPDFQLFLFFFTLFSFFLHFVFLFSLLPFVFFYCPSLHILSIADHSLLSLPLFFFPSHLSIVFLYSLSPFLLIPFPCPSFSSHSFFLFFSPPPPPHCSYLLSVLYPEFSLLYQVVTLSKSSPEYGDICGGSDVGNSSLTGLIYSGSLGSVVGCVSMGWIGTKTGAKAIKQDTL